MKRDPQVISNLNWVILENGQVGLEFDMDGVRTTRTDMTPPPTPAPAKRDADPQVISNLNWVILENGQVGLEFDMDGVRTTRTDMTPVPTAAA